MPWQPEPRKPPRWTSGLSGASIVATWFMLLRRLECQGRVALGARAGARVRRLGHGPTAGSDARGPRHAHVEGFDLPANVWVGAHDRARREQLCRYLLRPPLADDRLRLLGDGRVRVQRKQAWSDGTTHRLFEAVEFLGKLAGLTPRPAINLVLYHDVLAPRAGGPEVVAYSRPGATGPEETTRRAGGDGERVLCLLRSEGALCHLRCGGTVESSWSLTIDHIDSRRVVISSRLTRYRVRVVPTDPR